MASHIMVTQVKQSLTLSRINFRFCYDIHFEGYTFGSNNGELRKEWDRSPAANPIPVTHIELFHSGVATGNHPIAMIQLYLTFLPFERHYELYEDYFVHNKGGSCAGKY